MTAFGGLSAWRGAEQIGEIAVATIFLDQHGPDRQGLGGATCLEGRVRPLELLDDERPALTGFSSPARLPARGPAGTRAARPDRRP